MAKLAKRVTRRTFFDGGAGGRHLAVLCAGSARERTRGYGSVGSDAGAIFVRPVGAKGTGDGN